MTSETSYNSTTSGNSNMITAPALALRLDTKPLLEDIEMYLKGEGIVLTRLKSGEIFERRISLSQAKANPIGIHSLLNRLRIIVNSAVVQGNFPLDSTQSKRSESYEMYVEEVNISLAEALVLNCYRWEIAEEDIDDILDSIMNLIVPFMSRLIDNEERKGLTQSIRHIESATMQENPGRQAPAFNLGNLGGKLKW